MIITTVQINIECDGPEDDNMQPKSIVMNGNVWKLPPEIFPRDIRFVAALQDLINSYNGTRYK